VETLQTLPLDEQERGRYLDFTLQAVGAGNVNGFTYTINQADVRATTAAIAGYNTCASAWITKKGQAC
jgi:type IV pilus assembly protein PilE